ncbi:MAG TPA: TIGR02453 family protein [Nitriliruptorales bacterium]
MPTRHFTPALFEFLFDLDVHNDQAWFNQHRDRFERDVREPMLRFIEDLEKPLRKVSRHLVADPRKQGGSMFRIHRDTRFSNDKRPYKSNTGAYFRHELGRDVHAPGLYLHLEPGACMVGAGIWRPQTADLNRIRDAIVDKPGPWRRTLDTAAWVEHGWKRSDGDPLTRAPKGYDVEHPLIDELRRRSHTVGLALRERDVTRASFLDDTIERWVAVRPYLRFLGGAFDLSF